MISTFIELMHTVVVSLDHFIVLFACFIVQYLYPQCIFAYIGYTVKHSLKHGIEWTFSLLQEIICYLRGSRFFFPVKIPSQALGANHS